MTSFRQFLSFASASVLAAAFLSLPASRAAEPLLLQRGTIDTASVEVQAESAALKAKVAKKAAAARKAGAAAESRAAYVVQFPGPVTEEWRIWLESATQVRGYLPEFAYLVWATPSEMDAIAAHENVFWTGEWKKEYKTVRAAAKRASSSEACWMHVGSLLTGSDGAADLRARLEALPADVQDAFARLDGSSAVALLSDAQLDEVASWPDVEWIEPKLEPRLFNDKAALTNMMNVANAWKSLSSGGLGLTGAGQIVAIADTGCDKGSTSDTHADFSGRILAGYGWKSGSYGSSYSWADYDSHGTHCCGSILGSGAASTNQFRGMAYEAQLVMQGCQTNLSGLPDNTHRLLFQAYNAGARIHSDSWGYTNADYHGDYVYAAVYSDAYMWTNQNFLMVIAAGNDGIDADSDGVIDATSVTAPGTAKNCLCVGAAENYRSSGGYAALTYGGKWPSDYPADPIKSDKISSTNVPQGIVAFSGRGPTKDGRIKPDIVAPGTDVVSVRSRLAKDNGWGIAANTNYLYMGGTSMATPLTAGATALVRQWLVERHGIAEPSAALMKALLINGARDMNPGQFGTGAYREITARPDRSQGFGHVDLFNSLSPGDGRFLHFATNTIAATYGDFTTNLLVGAANAGTYRITLAWQDYPGKTSAAKTLVNDLDLIVTSPSGTRVYPNALGRDDHTNNIESVEFAAPETGTWTVRVYGNNIAETAPHGGQPFALVLSGPVTGEPEAAAPRFAVASYAESAALGEDFLFDFEPLLFEKGWPEPSWSITSSLPADAWEAADSFVSFTPGAADTAATFVCTASNAHGASTCTLTVTVVQPLPTVPGDLAVSAVSTDSFVVAWSPVPAASYVLDVATVTGSGGTSELVGEHFASITTSDTEITTALDTYTASPGWTGSKVFSAPGQIKLGSGNYNGWIVTPALDIPADAVLSCKISKYSNDGGTVAVNLSTDGGGTWSPLVASIVPVTGGETCAYTFDRAYPGAKIQFISSAKRFYLDDIVLTAPAASYASLDGYPRSVGAATNAVVTGLSPSTDYAVRVRAVNDLGPSDWSDWLPVTTPAFVAAPTWQSFPETIIPGSEPFELPIGNYVTGDPFPDVQLSSPDPNANPLDYDFDLNTWNFIFFPSLTADPVPGTYSFVFTASNLVGTADATLSVTVVADAVFEDFQAWLTAHNLPTDTSPSAPAANGLTYFENYVATLDPASTNLLEFTCAPADGSLSITPLSPDRDYQLLYYTNLLSTPPSVIPLGLGATNPFLFPLDATGFGRLRVTLPP